VKTLGVLFGGRSSEYAVSLHSAASFLRQIHPKYNLKMIGISKDGDFYEYTGSIDDLEHDKWNTPDQAFPIAWRKGGYVRLDNGQSTELDAAFPVLHGKNGEDGTVQGLLELMNIHYVGCDVLSSAMVMDKEIMHILLKEAGIPAADYVCLRQNEPADFEAIEKKIPLPWIVKPCNAGSSYGVSKVESKEEFEPALAEAFKWDGRGKALVEECIDGFEIGCAVMGNDKLFAGGVDEIEISTGFFDYEGKYEMKNANIYCPARIDKETYEAARVLAQKAYRAMECLGFARVDMFVDKQGNILINELNAIPGMTATSRYPSMMKLAGLEFPDLIDSLIDLALEREIGAC
jgi:D-alanine---D-serine ligase